MCVFQEGVRNLNERKMSHQSFAPVNPKSRNSPNKCHRKFIFEVRSDLVDGF